MILYKLYSTNLQNKTIISTKDPFSQFNKESEHRAYIKIRALEKQLGLPKN